VRVNETFQLIWDTYSDWSTFLINPQHIRYDSLISWNRYESNILKNPVMKSDIIDLINKKQYTFQIGKDESIIQLYYLYDSRGNNLLEARLAFFSTQIIGLSKQSYKEFNTLSEDARILPDDFDDDLAGGVVSDRFQEGPVSWLRIDYAPDDAKGVLHYDCHMNISAFPYSRLVVSGVPNPRQFMELVMVIGYPESYRKHRLDAETGSYTDTSKLKEINKICYQCQNREVTSQIIHFHVPNNTLNDKIDNIVSKRTGNRKRTR